MSDCSTNAFKVPEKPELKPCPFCGYKPTIEGPEDRLAGTNIGIGYMISCPNENCFLGSNDSPISWQWLSEAIEAWNTRYEPTCQMIENEWSTKDGKYTFKRLICSNCLDEMELSLCSTGVYDDHLYYSYSHCAECGAKVVV